MERGVRPVMGWRGALHFQFIAGRNGTDGMRGISRHGMNIYYNYDTTATKDRTTTAALPLTRCQWQALVFFFLPLCVAVGYSQRGVAKPTAQGTTKRTTSCDSPTEEQCSLTARQPLSIAKAEARGVPRHHSRISRSPAVQSRSE
jgi:hypothetical protein